MTLPSQGYYSRHRVAYHSAATQRVWTPGHYISFYSSLTALSGGAVKSTAIAIYDAIAPKPAAKGVDITIIWSQCETALGVYDDSIVDAHLAACVARGLHLCIRVSHKTFALTDHAVPAYMQAGANDALYGNDNGGGTGNSSGGEYQISNGYVAKLNIEAVYARFVAWLNHLGSKYNSNPNVEMFYFNESSQGTAVNYTLTSAVTTNFFANLTRVGAAAKAGATSKIIAQLFNFPQDKLASIYSGLIANGVGLGNPDTFTSTIIGETRNSEPYNHNIALAGAAAAFTSPNDYDRAYTYSADANGKIPIVSLVSPDSWDHDRPHQTDPTTYIAPATASELRIWCRDQLKSTHMFWYYNNGAPAAYNAGTAYSYRDLVAANGVTYQSKILGTGTNTGNAVTDTNSWQNLGDTFPAMDKQFYPLMDSLASLPGGGLNTAYPSLL